MKRFSTSLLTKKMQIKTTMRHYLTPTRMKLKIQLKILIENRYKDYINIKKDITEKIETSCLAFLAPFSFLPPY